MNPVRSKAYLELLIVSVIWGFATPIIKYTLGGFSPAVFLTYRFFISFVIALVIMAATKFKLPKNPKVLALTLFNGFLLTTVTLGLLFLGTDQTTSIDSNLISTMAPIVIAVAGVFFLKEHITKRESVGILIALAGTLITIIEPVLKMQDGFGGLQGNLLVFASVLV
ncbi:MAG TPA: DMT family transporter, partial [Patescibacteria group bacterium]|nr:DMT family transporter [Patescibacteria group bacterium]